MYTDAWAYHKQHYKKIHYKRTWHCTTNQSQANKTATHATAKLKMEDKLSQVITRWTIRSVSKYVYNSSDVSA